MVVLLLLLGSSSAVVPCSEFLPVTEPDSGEIASHMADETYHLFGDSDTVILLSLFKVNVEMVRVRVEGAGIAIADRHVMHLSVTVVVVVVVAIVNIIITTVNVHVIPTLHCMEAMYSRLCTVHLKRVHSAPQIP